MAAEASPSDDAHADGASPTGSTAPDERINLIVLFGGQSAEHDVSCTTAAHVLRAADPAKYRITPIGISRSGTWAIATSALMALAEGPHTLPGRLDPEGSAVAPTAALSPAASGMPAASGRTVVMPLLHGPLGEDGTVQGLLELANVAYVGTGVLGSAVAMDKAMAKQVTAVHGIPQARYLALRAHEVTPGTPERIAAELGLPVFVKPANMGSSVGVSKAKTIEAVRDAIEVALRYDEWIVVEEAIAGREIEVGVLGNLEPRASLPGEIVPGAEFYDYADKYVDDGSQSLIPAPLTAEQTAEVQQLAVRAFTALRCEGLSRVDFFFEDGGRGFLLNEINTMPGFTPISMYPKLWIASGLSYRDLIDELVRLAIERHSRQRRNTDR
jgi:D-alanine-D-alanine ligase